MKADERERLLRGLAEARADIRRLAAELEEARARPAGCVYCGAPTRSKFRVCAEHRDLE